MVGEAACLVFGEDDVVIEGYLEGAAAGGDELEACQTVFVFIQHFFRQTDGFREVASRGAVFDAETMLLGHGFAPFGAVLRMPFRLPQYDSPGAFGSMVWLRWRFVSLRAHAREPQAVARYSL